ncbi:RepB family plasmid replication initiator protein [Candidatus Peregrinibacteria bacterium]|nr:RepB family plasmid replication initiator protein [Candidatus Peregrinibacteria bacterium]
MPQVYQTISVEDAEVIEEEILANSDNNSSEKLKESLLPAVIHPEANFLKLPFFALSWRGLKKKTKTEYKYIEERDGKKVELLWRVSSNTEYGYPTPFDRRVNRAIDAVLYDIIGKQGYPVENPIRFSIYQIARLMGIESDSSTLYNNIRESIERIVATTVKSEGSFYLKDEKRWLGKVFHIYESVVFRGWEMPSGEIAESNYLWLGHEYLRNVNAQFTRPLDYSYFVSLKSELASRLYELLSGKFFGLPDTVDHLRISYSNLCQILPTTKQRYYSKARENMDPAHEELIKTDFLSKVVYQRYKKKTDFNIKYYLGERAKNEKSGIFFKRGPKEEQLLLPLIKESDEDEQPLSGVALELSDRGITKLAAKSLAQSYREDYICQKLEMFDFLQSAENDIISRNPAGWLREAIEEDWQLSDEQSRKQERIEIKKQDQERYERWTEHRKTLIEQDIEDWDKITPEERVSGRLDLWKTMNPGVSKKEIEKQKQEYIAQLPKTEQEKREYLSRNYEDHPPDDFK